MPKKTQKTGSGRSIPSTHPKGELIGATVVGERGQVVIPKNIRDRMGLKPGIKCMVMQHGDSPIMLLPLDHMKTFIRDMSRRMSRALKESPEIE